MKISKEDYNKIYNSIKNNIEEINKFLNDEKVKEIKMFNTVNAFMFSSFIAYCYEFKTDILLNDNYNHNNIITALKKAFKENNLYNKASNIYTE